MAWTIGNFYCNQSQMEGNAQKINTYLSGKGWTQNAIAGMLGNMQTESSINPGIWQSLKEGNYSGGFGLVQWTPATNYTDWASANGYDNTDPEGQLIWIDTMMDVSGEWIATSTYPMTFEEFKTSTEEVETLASVFLKNFERAGVEKEEQRRTQARTWYDFIGENSGVYIVRFVPA